MPRLKRIDKEFEFSSVISFSGDYEELHNAFIAKCRERNVGRRVLSLTFIEREARAQVALQKASPPLIKRNLKNEANNLLKIPPTPYQNKSQASK